MLRVLIADDQEVMRLALRCILRQVPGIGIIDEVSDARQAIRRVLSDRWDVVFVDGAGQGADGPAILSAVAERKPDLPVIVVGGETESAFVFTAFRLGAAAYLSRRAQASEVLPAMQAALAGERFVSSDLAWLLPELDDLAHSFHSKPGHLVARRTSAP